MLLLKNDNRGTVLIEMAIVAPVLFLLLMGSIEIGLIQFTQSIVEGATAQGARMDNASAISGGLTPEAYIRQQIGTLSGGFLQPDHASILAQNQGNNVTLYRVTYPWPIFTPLIRPFLANAQGNFDITAIVAVRSGPL